MAKKKLLETYIKEVELHEVKHGPIIMDAPVFARGVFFPLGFSNKDFFKREKISASKTTVTVAELVLTASPKQIYDYLYKQGRCVLMDQEQIVTFCNQREEYLRKEGYGTLFFFKEGKTICYTYVTYMNPNDKGHMLTAVLHNEIKTGKFHGKFKHRVVYQ